MLLQALPVEINGSSTLPFQVVRVIVAKDYLTGSDSVLVSGKTDFKGAFQLQFELGRVEVAEIAIGLHRTSLLLKPGASYRVALSLQPQAEASTYFDPEALEIQTKTATDEGLLDQYQSINFIFNTFVVQRFAMAQRFGRTDYLDSLGQAIHKNIPKPADPFLTQYIYWKKASLTPAIKRLTMAQIFDTYFKNKQVEYRNPEYMALLYQYFGDYYVSSSRQTGLDGFVEQAHAGLKPLVHYLATDPLFDSDARLRELILLMHLHAFYHHPAFIAGDIAALLQQIAKSSAYQEHRQMANNIISARNRLAPGSKAPDMQLFDENNKQISLPTSPMINGLVFVRPNCPVCEKLLTEMQGLTQLSNGNARFVVVTDQVSLPRVKQQLQARGIHWPLLHPGTDILLLERLNIKVFPEVVLLYSDGRIAMAPAPTDLETLDAHLTRLAKQSE